MSKTTDALDATGEDAPLADRRRGPVAASSARRGTEELARALEGGADVGEALLASRPALGARPPLGTVRFQRVGGVPTGEPDLREGSYRGHPVFVRGDGVGLELLQALALLDEVPLSDLPVAERARRVAHVAAAASADGAGGRPADARFEPAHLEALLDREPPPRVPRPTGPSALAAAIDLDGNAAALAGSDGLAFVVLRSGRPLLAAGVGGDALLGALALLVRLLDEGRALAEAAQVGPGAQIAAVLIDDALEREAVIAGCPDGATAPSHAGSTSRHA